MMVPNKQLANIANYSEEKRTELSQKYYKDADDNIAQIEDLLEIKKSPASRKEKISNLTKYFIKTDS